MIHALKPVRTVAPVGLPVTLAEAKQHLRVVHSDDDTMIGAYLEAAVAQLDGWSGILGRCLVTQTWRVEGPHFCEISRLPFPDVSQVVVSYTDPEGAPQTLAGSSYHLVTDAMGSALVLADGQTWPDTAARPDAAMITMTCGYGAASAVPAGLRAAILLHVGTLYENRETLTEGVASNRAYEALVAPHRMMRI